MTDGGLAEKFPSHHRLDHPGLDLGHLLNQDHLHPLGFHRCRPLLGHSEDLGHPDQAPDLLRLLPPRLRDLHRWDSSGK